MHAHRKSRRRSRFVSRRGRRVGQSSDRRLHIEALEDRRMLAAITVTSFADDLVVDGMVTLREAIQAANTDTSVDGSEAGNGIDGIKFSGALSGQTIKLNGELQITEALTIDATALANNVTVDAQDNSRIFNITATNGDFTLAGLTLTRGRTTGDNAFLENTFSGGAIRSVSNGSLTLDQSTVTGNSTTGVFAEGGAIYTAGTVTLTDSTISANSTTNSGARGGAISSRDVVTLTGSTVSGNSTADTIADGGGIFTSDAVTLTGSTVSGNSTIGFGSDGGGIAASGTVTLTSSTVSNNSTEGVVALGGGIKSASLVALIGSTVSGNSTEGEDADGGGIYSKGYVTLASSSTVSGNSTTGEDAKGGGIFSFRDVTLTSSTVSDNSTTGSSGMDQSHFRAEGGGIYSLRDVTLTNSTVSGNSTAGRSSDGGGIYSIGTVTLLSSTVSGNSTTGDSSGGGGIYTFDEPVLLFGSTVSGNFTTGPDGNGGGIFSNGAVTLTSSTISGNRTAGNYASGGGIFSFGTVTLTSSTVSGNSTAGSGAKGGGIFSRGNVNLTSSTVTDNVANHINVPGGGIAVLDTTITITHSIVSDNQSGGGNPDIHPAGTSVIDANYSLLGTAVTPDTGADNLFNNAPLLGPLASNGGPTETHALLGLSPAINAGDLNFDDAVTPTDQRGAPFVRVAGFRVDIGAFELQGTSSTDSADFDTDGDIDGRDFLLWQRGFGTPNANKYDGDADDNDNVNGLDLGIWQSQFGFPAPVAAASVQSAISDQPSAELIDAVMALVDDGQVAESPALDEDPIFAEVYADHIFAVDGITPADNISDEDEQRDTNSGEDDEYQATWLADELLERVFG